MENIAKHQRIQRTHDILLKRFGSAVDIKVVRPMVNAAELRKALEAGKKDFKGMPLLLAGKRWHTTSWALAVYMVEGDEEFDVLFPFRESPEVQAKLMHMAQNPLPR